MSESQLADLRREVEEGLVSICFVDPVSIDQAATIVSPADFVDPDLADVFRVVTDLREARRIIEPHAVMVEAQRRGLVGRLTPAYIAQLANSGYAAANATYYAATVARLAKNRRLMNAARALLEFENDVKTEPSELVGRFEAATSGLLTDRDGGFVSFADAAAQTIAEHRAELAGNGQRGFGTGFPSLDSIVGGFFPGQLVLLGGRTFAGKTALALSISSYFANHARPVWFVSLEMSRTELAERILADDCGFELRQFTQGGFSADTLDALESNVQGYRDWPLVITDSPHESVRTIRAKAKLRKTSGLNLLVVDNLQLVTPENRQEPRRIQLETIARQLKQVAKELECVVLLLCQLNAEAEKSEPDDTHYAEGKQILSHADISLLAHRADKTDSNFMLKITKNRRGKSDRITLHFDGAYQRFTDPMYATTWTG